MDFMKVFDQAVREIKREVNLKVLKVPEIEQKVLDATNDEPWGPHGSALSEISQATKKFSECQIVMEVLWIRLTDSGPNWRHVYKALTVIEYLLANGSERAVDDILEHSFQISSLSSFEYVEPNGKDVGINVRKKVETLMGLLGDKEKLHAVRNKASANRDKYVGLSSTGITYKSGSNSYGGSHYRDKDRYGDDADWKYSKKDDYEEFQERPSRSKMDSPKKTSEIHEASKSGPVKKEEEDFDEFDPRGSSTSASTSFNQVDLFGDSLLGDLMDVPATTDVASDDVDLFADAAFVSAAPRAESSGIHKQQDPVDFFSNQSAVPASSSSSINFFTNQTAAPPASSSSSVGFFANQTASPPVSSSSSVDFFANQTMAPAPSSSSSVGSFAKVDFDSPAFDPFATVQLNAFEEPDAFGDFASHSDSTPGNVDPPPRKETFQVKSGIWADSLSRGLIDLNLTAPKKASLTDPPAPTYGVRGNGSSPGQQDPFGGFY